MKKLIAIALALVLALSLAACGAEENPNEDMVITRGPDEVQSEDQPQEQEQEEVTSGTVYAFTHEGVKLVPGADFDPGVLGEASSLYEVPSCAIEGTDNVYNYDSFEITAYDDGTGEVIYSIYFLDPNLTTDEGLAMGDDEAKVIELYGESYTEDGTARVYTGEGSQLYLIMQDGVVASIEYRMIVE